MCVDITKFSHPPSHRGLRGEQKVTLTCVPSVVSEVHAKLAQILHAFGNRQRCRNLTFEHESGAISFTNYSVCVNKFLPVTQYV
jgi:hypothetical protein